MSKAKQSARLAGEQQQLTTSNTNDSPITHCANIVNRFNFTQSKRNVDKKKLCAGFDEIALVGKEKQLAMTTRSNDDSETDMTEDDKDYVNCRFWEKCSPDAMALVGKEGKNCFLVNIEKDFNVITFHHYQHNSWQHPPVTLPLPNGQWKIQLEVLGSVLYAFGGFNDDNVPTNQMWSFNLADPSSSQWTEMASMSYNRSVITSVVLNEDIYVFGAGEIDRGNYEFNRCERYNSKLNQWSAVAKMKRGVNYGSAAVLNGCIYVAEGKSDYDDFGTGRKMYQPVEKYDPLTDTWSDVAPMNTARDLQILISFAGRLWAIGGEIDNGAEIKPVSNVESYDPVSDTWRVEAPLKEDQLVYTTAECNGELFIVTGQNKDNEGGIPAIAKNWAKSEVLPATLKVPKLFTLPIECLPFFTSKEFNN